MLYVGIALLILLVFMIGISVYLVIYAMKNMHHHSLEDSRAWQEHHYDLSWYDSMRTRLQMVRVPLSCSVTARPAAPAA